MNKIYPRISVDLEASELVLQSKAVHRAVDVVKLNPTKAGVEPVWTRAKVAADSDIRAAKKSILTASHL